ncbi:MAG: hypothetical protein ABSC26_09095 [Stellaceae bacterium]|jgi:hypothetical protein
MLDQAMHWWSVHICNLVGSIGLPNQFCIPGSSYNAGILFWSVIGIGAILVASRFIGK